MSESPVEYAGPAPELASSVLARALRRGGDSADLFVEQRRSLSMRLEDRQDRECRVGAGSGRRLFGLITGMSTVFGYVDAVDETSLTRPGR